MTQGHFAQAVAYSPLDTVRAVGAAYCPVDGYRYFFYATRDNTVLWTRRGGSYKNPPTDPILSGLIHIKRSIVKQRIGPPKTEASQKPIPLNAELAKSLRLWKMKQPTIGPTIGSMPVPR